MPAEQLGSPPSTPGTAGPADGGPTTPAVPGTAPPGDRARIAPLDGVRAFAVTAVILFHATPSWAVGGYFGVDVFFVLSGYLITSLLLAEWRRTGGIALRAFWVRRARRLLPALFLMLAVVGVVAAALPRVLGSPGLLGDTVATVGYVANWHFVAAHTDYFATVANPSPLQHTWTLAIEEQFYLVWPLVLLGILAGARRLRRRLRRRRGAGGERGELIGVAVAAGAGAIASALLMALITPVGAASVARSYYGSDTRAQALLVGAALAAVCLWWGPVRTGRGRRALLVVGLAGGAAVVAMWRTVTETSALTFHGGFALLALGTAAVIGSVTQWPDHPLARVLSLRPLPYVGRVSYGMYLWYWPVLLVMTSGRTHLQGVALLGARLVVIMAIAAVSFRFLETPIRRGVLAGWRSWVGVPAAALAVCLVALLVPAVPGSGDTGTGTSTRPPAGPDVAAPAGPAVRILLVGDSVAGSLGVGLGAVAPRYGAEVVNRGSPGCSLAEGDLVQVLWFTNPPGVPCQAGHPGHLLEAYRALVRQFNPDVVVYVARGDTLTSQLDGTWQHLGEPSFDRWALSRFEQGVKALGSGGARVVVLTSPLYDSGEQGDGQPWPENDPARVTVDNRLLAEAARRAPGATVLALGAMLSPSGRFATRVDGVAARCSDGVHLTVAGGRWIGSRLLPRLVALGRSHASSPAAQARAPIAPEPAPWWYAKLPCGT